MLPIQYWISSCTFCCFRSMKVLQQWMPVQTMKMRGSQEALLLNQTDCGGRSTINQYEPVVNGRKLNQHYGQQHQQQELLQRLNTHHGTDTVASTEFITQADNGTLETQADSGDGVPHHQVDNSAPADSYGKKPFVRRFSMQLNSNSLDNLKSFTRRTSGRRGSIPFIPSPIANVSEPIKSSHTAPNPFPELINSPPVTPISHSRSQSCTDDHTDHKLSSDDDHGENSSQNAAAVERVRAESFDSCRLSNSPSNSSLSFSSSRLANSPSNNSLTSCNSTTPMLPPATSSSSNNYIHSSVIAARAKHILLQHQHCHSSPSSPAISRRKANLSDSLVANGEDNTGSYCYTSIDGKSSSNSPTENTGNNVY